MAFNLIKYFKLLCLPKERFIYVVLEGKYKGEWLVQAKKKQDSIVFFSLPDKFVRDIPLTDVEWGLSNKVIVPVDVLPKGVYNVCIAEYNYKTTEDEKNNALNRREQHITQDPLDSE